MDPTHPDIQNVLINKIIIDEIIEQDEREFAAFAALLTLVKNKQESSDDDYDSEYDYESATGSQSHEDEGDEEDSVIPKRALNQPVVRKRAHCELNSSALPPARAPPQASKRVRIEGIPLVPQPSNLQPTTETKSTSQQTQHTQQTQQTLYSPDEAICKINPKTEAFAYDRASAIAQVKMRYGGMAMEKAMAIVSTRFLNDAVAARKYSGLLESAKEIYFNQLLREGFDKPWAPMTQAPKDGGANPLPQKQPKDEQERAKPVAPAPKRDHIPTTKLRSDVLKQVDARSQGKLEDRVRLWLDNVIPN